MITRMKGFFLILGFILLISAVDGAAHVSVVARRALDPPLVSASPGTATPRSTGAEAPSARLNSPVVSPASANDGSPDARRPISVTMGTSPLTSTAASSSDRRGISSEPGIGAAERELRDLKLRDQMADRQMDPNQTEPPPTPQMADATGEDADFEDVPSVEAVPVATLQTPAPDSTPAAPLPSSPSEVGQGRWIDVDLTHQLLTAYEGSAPVRNVAVSTGLAGTPTPVGQFRIWVKFRYDDMEGPGYYLPNVPYTMYFHEGYGLHGTYWHNNFGHPMSHGCVNLPTSEAEWVFNWAEVGTLVNVHN